MNNEHLYNNGVYRFNNDDFSNFFKLLNEVKQIIKEDEDLDELSVDMLLDMYNDYMSLYNTFGDNEYKVKASKIMERLKCQ